MKTKPYLDCNFLRISNGRNICIFDARGDQIDYCTQSGCPIRDRSSDGFRVMDLIWREVEPGPDTETLSPPPLPKDLDSRCKWLVFSKGHTRANRDCDYIVNFGGQETPKCAEVNNPTSECTFNSCPIRVGMQTPEKTLAEDLFSEAVNHPYHYCSHPSGIECIQVTQHFNFNRGNAIKYIWRAGQKEDAIKDLKKARKYIDFEIERIENESK